MSDQISVKTLYFGQLRDVVGMSEVALEVPAGCTSQDLFTLVAKKYPRLAELRGSIVLARNAAFVREPEVLEDGDEIGFLPPVSGGSGRPEGVELMGVRWLHEVRTDEGHFFGLTRDVIDGGRIAREILRDEDGAFVNFEGVVRNHSNGRRTRFLDYECYESLAIRTMTDLGREIALKYGVGCIAIVHRLGRLAIGETSVAVVVSSPHRRAAFDAALEGINRLKTTVPVWKKEYFEDGEVWVEGSWDDAINRVGDARADGGAASG
jgi:molybdopterin synthase catalytic subunit